MLKINLAGTKSAYDVVGDPELQSLGIARIKPSIAPMGGERHTCMPSHIR